MTSMTKKRKIQLANEKSAAVKGAEEQRKKMNYNGARKML
jgi:hypothetical protein